MPRLMIVAALLCTFLNAQELVTTNTGETISTVVKIDDIRSIAYSPSGDVILITHSLNGSGMTFDYALDEAQVFAFATVPVAPAGEGEFVTTYTDVDGIVHRIVTPNSGGGGSGGSQSLRDHINTVKLYKSAFPPKKPT